MPRINLALSGARTKTKVRSSMHLENEDFALLEKLTTLLQGIRANQHRINSPRPAAAHSMAAWIQFSKEGQTLFQTLQEKERYDPTFPAMTKLKEAWEQYKLAQRTPGASSAVLQFQHGATYMAGEVVGMLLASAGEELEEELEKEYVATSHQLLKG